jgi:ferric-dicitrate binding protein FerR (iron transport regulator)
VEQLFLKYLHNQCTEAEVREVLRLLGSEEGKAVMARLLLAFEAEAIEPDEELSPTPEQSASGWARLEAHLAESAPGPISPQATPIRSGWVRRFAQVAAVLLLPLGIGLYYYVAGRADQTSEEVVYATEYAQTKQFTLPDGSLVTLNGNSRIRHARDWEHQSSREVWLEGEGFFQVTHSSHQQKFLVHTRRSHTVEVLGTEFNVADRSTGTEVKLKTGKIRLIVQEGATRKSMTMKPGLAVTIHEKAEKIEVRETEPALVAAWRENKLVFDAKPLGEIVSLLKDTYNIEVVISDPRLLQERITGTIPSGNLDDLMKALSRILQLDYTQEANRVTFYSPVQSN